MIHGANTDTGQTANTGQGEVAQKDMNANSFINNESTTVLLAEAELKATEAEVGVTPVQAAVGEVERKAAKEERKLCGF